MKFNIETLRFISWVRHEPSKWVVEFYCREFNPNKLDSYAMRLRLKHRFAEEEVDNYIASYQLYKDQEGRL